MSHALVAPPAALITIPFSHYCEKARWGLDRAGAHYVERGYLPMIHVPFVKAAGGARMVPVLATREGVIGDSTAILRWCDAHTIAPGVAALWPEHAAQADEVARWEDAFDTTVGVDARRLAYGHVLGDRGYMDGLVARVVPRWQQLLFQCVRPLAIGGIRRGLRINDEGVARSLARLEASFVAVGAALSDGRRYLVGGRFTAADLTFAALSAPVLLPPELSHYYGARDAVPEAFGALVDRLRATPAGSYGLRLYAEERGRIGAGHSLPSI